EINLKFHFKELGGFAADSATLLPSMADSTMLSNRILRSSRGARLVLRSSLGRWWPAPLEHRDETAGLGARVVARSGLVADEIACLEYGAVGIDELAFEDEELFHARMVVLDGDGAGLHAHEIAALSAAPLEADRQPAHLRLQRAIEIIGQEFGLGDADDSAVRR